MAQRTVAKKSARNDASDSNHSKSTGAPSVRKRNQFCHAVLLKPSSKLQPINAVQETYGGKTCGTSLNTFISAMRSTSRESSNHTHAARDLAVRGSNKNSVTPQNREAVFRNLGVVQDLLRKWCHQFRTAAWPRRIMTTSLSQHHSNEARLSWVVKKRAHTTTQIKMSAVTFAVKLFKHTANTVGHRFAFVMENVHFETPLL